MIQEEEEPLFEKSSGNVFRDLGLPDAEERLEKANLAYEIFRTITNRRLTQRKAAEIMGIDQPKVSAIVRGNLKGFSLERLIALLKKLGVDVHIAKKSNIQVSMYANPIILTGETLGTFPALPWGGSFEYPASTLQYATTGSMSCIGTLGTWAGEASPLIPSHRNERERPENEPAPLAA